VRKHCEACRSGKRHPSYALCGRINGRRSIIYVPDELVPAVQKSLDNGRALQNLLYESAFRYANALKAERVRRQNQKVKK
jgi:hypothetical protein